MANKYSTDLKHGSENDQGGRIRFRGPKISSDKIIKAMENTAVKEEFMFGDVFVSVTRDHILPSQCHHTETLDEEHCQVCEYNGVLKLPQLPEMVFPNNSVIFTVPTEPGLRISFNSLDALKSVDAFSLPNVEVGPSKEWQQCRGVNVSHMKRGSRPYDWTYTSDYKGTVEGYTVVPTSERISVEQLRRRDPIRFYSHVMLYEDELADHGCSEMGIRLRIMPNCLFLLCRFYLRVDDVLVRICDTRLYKELNSKTYLRHWTRRESRLADSSPLIRNNVLNPDIIHEHLPVVEEELTKFIPLTCDT